MQQYRTFWLLLTMMLVGGFTLTSCVDSIPPREVSAMSSSRRLLPRSSFCCPWPHAANMRASMITVVTTNKLVKK